jgi:hypothetical protein
VTLFDSVGFHQGKKMQHPIKSIDTLANQIDLFKSTLCQKNGARSTQEGKYSIYECEMQLM